MARNQYHQQDRDAATEATSKNASCLNDQARIHSPRKRQRAVQRRTGASQVNAERLDANIWDGVTATRSTRRWLHRGRAFAVAPSSFALDIPHVAFSIGEGISQRKAAAGLVVLKYLATALQVADMFTKQIFPKHFERLRRVMMGHENFDDMCERYQDAKAAGDDVDDPKLYTVKPARPPNG